MELVNINIVSELIQDRRDIKAFNKRSLGEQCSKSIEINGVDFTATGGMSIQLVEDINKMINLLCAEYVDKIERNLKEL